jgi:myosin-1
MKERKFHESATKIARTWRAYKMKSYFATLRDSAADLLQGKKQRRRLSLNKFFSGDYIKYSSNAQIQQVMKPYGKFQKLLKLT